MNQTVSTRCWCKVLCAVAAVAALCMPASAAACARISRLDSFGRGDVLRVTRDEGACVVTVRHRHGIGAVRLTSLAPVQDLRLRFDGFPELESLVLSSPGGRLLCEVNRSAATVVARRCLLNGAQVSALRPVAGGFELTVPADLVPVAGNRLEVHWTDFWR